MVCCPAVSGCYSQRGTFGGVVESIKDAFRLCLEDRDAWHHPAFCDDLARTELTWNPGKHWEGQLTAQNVDVLRDGTVQGAGVIGGQLGGGLRRTDLSQRGSIVPIVKPSDLCYTGLVSEVL